MEQERRLIIIPVVHTNADWGLPQCKFPINEEMEAASTGYWVKIIRYLRGLPLDFSRVKVYQDSLSNTKPEIVESYVSQKQGTNYKVLRWLKDQGATILGTEDPLSSYFMDIILVFGGADDYLKATTATLQERDRYIAQRIRQTLGKGETGILFIGAAHQVENLLTEELNVETPLELKSALPEVLGKIRRRGKERE